MMQGLLRAVGVLAVAAPVALFSGAPRAETIMATLRGDADFTRLVGLIEAAGMAETFEEQGPMTFLAPTNAAFVMLPDSALQKIADDGLLADVLKHHLIKGEAYTSDTIKGLAVATVGDRLQFETNETGTLRVYQDGSEVTRLGDNLIVRHLAPYRPTTEAPRPPVPGASSEAEPTSDEAKKEQTAASYALGESVEADDKEAGPASENDGSDNVQSEQGQGTQQQKGLGDNGSAATPDPMVRAQNDPEQKGQAPEEQKTYLGPGEDPLQDKKVRVAQVARVVRPDIRADDGVIQGVDRILLPTTVVDLFEPQQSASAE